MSQRLDFKVFHLEVTHDLLLQISVAKASQEAAPNLKEAGQYSPAKKFLQGGEVKILVKSSKVKCAIIYLKFHFFKLEFSIFIGQGNFISSMNCTDYQNLSLWQLPANFL